MVAGPWYDRFEEYRDQVDEKKERFEKRCKELGMQPRQIQEEPWRDLIARIVRESNWQEKYFLTVAETRELADAVFDEPIRVSGPHLDMNGIVAAHREQVVKLKREKRKPEDIAAFNLSRAHMAIGWIFEEMVYRHLAAFSVLLDVSRREMEGLPEEHEQKKDICKAVVLMTEIRSFKLKSTTPLNIPIETIGEMLTQLTRDGKADELFEPMREEHLHFLHRITTLGLIETKKCGVYRKGPVHIPGNPGLIFPPASAVRGLMREFCVEFPSLFRTIVATTKGVTIDVLLDAARASHGFVRIHPYADGNGRLSRLVMNLVLHLQYPPACLKADKKGRHRYQQALKRADRGNYKPLASLIALSLSEVYDRLLESVAKPPSTEPLQQCGDRG